MLPPRSRTAALFWHGATRDAIVPCERATVLQPDNPARVQQSRRRVPVYRRFRQGGRRILPLSRYRADAPAIRIPGVVHYNGTVQRRGGDVPQGDGACPGDHLHGQISPMRSSSATIRPRPGGVCRAPSSMRKELADQPQTCRQPGTGSYYASRLETRRPSPKGIEDALAEGGSDAEVYLYVGLAALGFGDEASAVRHVRHARDLGYPDVFLSPRRSLARSGRCCDYGEMNMSTHGEHGSDDLNLEVTVRDGKTMTRHRIGKCGTRTFRNLADQPLMIATSSGQPPFRESGCDAPVSALPSPPAQLSPYASPMSTRPKNSSIRRVSAMRSLRIR